MQEIVNTIWVEKYRFGNEASPLESKTRVANAVFAKDPRRDEFLPLVIEAMHKNEFSPGGRIHAGAGTGRNVTLLNCFSGKEKFITREHGVIDLASMSGKHVTVLTRKGWADAKVKEFGLQAVQKVVLRPAHVRNGIWFRVESNVRKEVIVTPNHRWVLESGIETTDIKVKDIVPCASVPFSPRDGESEEFLSGFRHGIVFADGAAGEKRPRTGFNQFSLRLCGARKNYFLHFFERLITPLQKGEVTTCERVKVCYPPSGKGDACLTVYSDKDLKSVPTKDETVEYMSGFIRGWIEFDGHTQKRDSNALSIHSQDHEALDWLAEHAVLTGMVVTGDFKATNAKTNYGVRKALVRALMLKKTERRGWSVESITPLAEKETVYCAVVPNVGEFTLTSGVVTGNCYMAETIEDSMAGIMRANTNAALTMQQGGGIGMDFSTIRPKGAVVKGVGSVASGPLSFMEIWQAMCGTVMSGGSRRGAMLAGMSVDHPDVIDFIQAKREAGKFTNFNVSVLVTDDFMQAVEKDASWFLGFDVPPADGRHEFIPFGTRDRNGKPWYVYRSMKARELWELITRNTYEYAEPGVIFIDQYNKRNNLAYCETIRTTNPCGEIGGPPHGTCDLGCINLAALVRNPFTSAARIDSRRLVELATLGVRFLDNVLDVTNYPIPEQAEESRNKRRIGLGIMGLGNALQMLGLRYGGIEAARTTKAVMGMLADAAYFASAKLAQERGSFKLFDADKFLERPFVLARSLGAQEAIRQYGIRNGVLLTVAPTGTTAIYEGNVSSGLEPTFAWRYFRKVLQPDGTHREFAVVDAGFEAYCAHHGLDPATAPTTGLPSYMATALELSIDEHLVMQAACQEYIDSSISKTINVPTETTYEEFQEVYRKAYDLGCKGCTTYRPSGVRGSVLSTESSVAPVAAIPHNAPAPLPKRPDVLSGKTYKVKWPLTEDSFYVTVNDTHGEDGKLRPFEVFVASRSTAHAELFAGLTILISAILRRQEHPAFIVEDLERVQSAQGAWIEGRYVPGVVALIAGVLRQHLVDLGMFEPDSTVVVTPVETTEVKGEPCPKCGAPALIFTDGCKKCLSCSYSACG